MLILRHSQKIWQLYGNEYDSAEKLVNATGLIIGEVKTCEMHPDSDHLHVCTVDIGKEILNIVCGAPNVKKGQKVIVAMAGSTLPRWSKNKKRHDKRARIKWNDLFFIRNWNR